MLTQDPDTTATDDALAPARPAPAKEAVAARRPKSKVRAALHRALVGKRGPLVKVHRWVSFVLLAWVVLEGLTGSALVFAPEIDHAVNHAQFTPTAGDVGPAKAMAAARKARPDDVVRFVTTPASGDTGGMYLVYTTDTDAEYHSTVVDPGTGKVTSADHHEPGWLSLAERLHFNLNSTAVFGFAPLSVMGWMSAAWLLVIATGIYLWYWPGVKRWARAVKVRRKRGRFTFHLDLHKAVGLVTIVPLTLVAITGINFAFPEQVRSVWNVVTFGTYDEHPSQEVSTSTPIAGATPISADDAAAIVQRLDRNLRISAVTTPGGSPVGVWEVDATSDHAFLSSAGGEHDISFDVDQYTGQVLSVEDPHDKSLADTAYDDWSYDVHFGTFGGTTTKVLWVGLGIAPVVLGITGTVMWFVRRGKRKRRGDRTPAAAPTELVPAAPGTRTDPKDHQ